MSKKSRALKRAREELSAVPRVTKAGSPADVVTLIPYVLGFEPADSVVVVSLVGPRKRFGPVMRVDLVAPDDALELVDYLMGVIRQHRFASVLAVAFSADEFVAGCVMDPLYDALEAHGLKVVEALRTDGTRWWSYSCSDPSCCPPEGTPLDARASSVAVEMVVAGLAKAESREALRQQVEPADPRLCAEVDELCRSQPRLVKVSPAEVRERVADALVAGQLDARALADLLVLVQDIERRDAAWMMMTRATAEQHQLVWQQVTRAAPPDLLPPAGSLAGWAAWLAGHGVLASHACDRVDEVAPGYRMNVLLRRALDGAVNPDVWDGERRWCGI